MTKSLLDLAAEGLYRELRLHGNDLAKVPEVTRPIALLYMFQGMVDNGGFRYPLETDYPGNPPYSLIVDAYRRIGAVEAATALDQVVARFTFPHPEHDTVARNEFMSSLAEDDPFFELCDRACGDETIWKQMDEYVAKHHKDFAPFITQ